MVIKKCQHLKNLNRSVSGEEVLAIDEFEGKKVINSHVMVRNLSI